MVHHTMPTRTAPASNDSNNSHPMIAAPMIARVLAVAGALLLSACQTPPVAPPAPVAPAAATGRVLYTPVGYDALPGWSSDAMDAAWPALLVQCRALVNGAATRDAWTPACNDAAAMGAPDAASARAFFESHF